MGKKKRVLERNVPYVPVVVQLRTRLILPVYTTPSSLSQYSYSSQKTQPTSRRTPRFHKPQSPPFLITTTTIIIIIIARIFTIIIIITIIFTNSSKPSSLNPPSSPRTFQSGSQRLRRSSIASWNLCFQSKRKSKIRNRSRG